MKENLRERLQLCIERIEEIRREKKLENNLQEYFEDVADFILMVEEHRQWIEAGNMTKASMEELQLRNHRLYQDVLPKHYEESYANPAYAVYKLGEKGQLLSALYAEIRSIITETIEPQPAMMVSRLELFLEIYGLVLEEESDESLKEAFYWFAYDYAEDIMEKALADQYGRKATFIDAIVKEYSGADLRYLYYYQEYVTAEQIRLAEYMNSLPGEKVKRMADTCTEGFQRGFEASRKDLSIKKSVNVYFTLGMEAVVKEVIDNFAALGLWTCLFRAPSSFLAGRSLIKSGFYGANANRQFEYDHEYDNALYLSSKSMNRKLEAYRNGLELYKKEVSLMAGPAVLEDFGEEPFVPVPKKENLKLSQKQRELFVEYRSKARLLLNEYAKMEEKSFTIIAFPTPAIGERFEEIFDETIALNTLDNEVYERYQQIIIDVLDQARYIRVRGQGQNRTDMRVALWELKNPEKETNFENCVGDVNIPVGEVFTSPRLTGTEGILHVPRVFLNGLEYRDLEISFRDGMITDYSCGNFEKEEENKKLIKEKLLANRDTLPLGEFAIGTNTTAYMAIKKFGIENLAPILIAEKTGPHFAIGDTCYSMEEDVVSYNSDGKRIVAKENEMSRHRKTDPSKAYFQCHTDITIPYDELQEVTAVRKDGTECPVIQKGRFVLNGLEELNKPFDE